MSEVDDKIRSALDAEDRALYDQLGEQSMLGMMTGAFKGRNWFLNVYAFVVSFVLFIGAIYCLVRFFQATETHAQLAWALGVWFGMMATGFIKLWFWLEIQRNQIIREVKRLELQVARLTHTGD